MKADKEKIFILMANKCMEVKDLEVQSNMPRSTLNKVLAGKRVRPVTLGKVAKALNVDVENIIERR